MSLKEVQIWVLGLAWSVYFIFIGPALISARSTEAVLFGLAIPLFLGRVTWSFAFPKKKPNPNK